MWKRVIRVMSQAKSSWKSVLDKVAMLAMLQSACIPRKWTFHLITHWYHSKCWEHIVTGTKVFAISQNEACWEKSCTDVQLFCKVSISLYLGMITHSQWIILHIMRFPLVCTFSLKLLHRNKKKNTNKWNATLHNDVAFWAIANGYPCLETLQITLSPYTVRQHGYRGGGRMGREPGRAIMGCAASVTGFNSRM